MLKNKPVTLLIASGLMIVLIVLVGVFQFTSVNAGGGRNGNFQPGTMPEGGTLPEGMATPEDGTMPEGFTPPDGATMPQDGSAPQGNFQPGNMSSDGSTAQGFPGGSSSASMKLMQLLNGVQIGAAILIMILGILSVVGIMLSQKWGRSLAVTTSIIVVLATIPGFFQRMSSSTIIEAIIKVVLAAAIIVLLFLPRSRQTVTTA